MPIRIQCPACRSVSNAPDAAAGKTLKCPKCTAAITIPPHQVKALPDENIQALAPPPIVKQPVANIEPYVPPAPPAPQPYVPPVQPLEEVRRRPRRQDDDRDDDDYDDRRRDRRDRDRERDRERDRDRAQNIKQVVHVHVDNRETYSGPSYSSLVAYVLWCGVFVGICGLHRFYLGKPLSGIVWLLTFGLLGFGQLLDLLLIPIMANEGSGGARRKRISRY